MKWLITVIFLNITSVLMAATPKLDVPLATKACDQSDMKACLRLAVYYERLGNVERMHHFYEITCRAGDETSCLKLGGSYQRDKNVGLAMKMYRRACRIPANTGQGCYEIAQFAAQADSDKSKRHWYEKACALGHTQSCTLINKSPEPTATP